MINLVFFKKILEFVFNFILLISFDEIFESLNFIFINFQLCELFHNLFFEFKVSEHFVKSPLQLGSGWLFDFLQFINVIVYLKGESSLIEFDLHNLLNNGRIDFNFLRFDKFCKILCLCLTVSVFLLWLTKFLYRILYLFFVELEKGFNWCGEPLIIVIDVIFKNLNYTLLVFLPNWFIKSFKLLLC